MLFWLRELGKNFLLEAVEVADVRSSPLQGGQHLVHLFTVGGEGNDPEIAATAGELAGRWLEDRDAVAPELVSTVLSLAVLHGDGDLFDRFLAAARSEEDATTRQRLLRSLGYASDPALRARALQLVFDEALDVRETSPILWIAGREPAGQLQVWRLVRDRWDDLLDRLPERSRAWLPRYAASFCTREKAEEVETFFAPRIDEIEGAPRQLAQTVEEIRLCAAFAEVQGAAVTRWLERRSEVKP